MVTAFLPRSKHLLISTQRPCPCGTTADLCLLSRYSNTQRQVWLSLCGFSGSWCTQGFVWALWVSQEGMGFDSKCDFPLLSCWGFSFPLGHRVSFFGGIQHSPVDGCSAACCIFGVLTEDEHRSFYPILFVRTKHQRRIIEVDQPCLSDCGPPLHMYTVWQLEETSGCRLKASGSPRLNDSPSHLLSPSTLLPSPWRGKGRAPKIDIEFPANLSWVLNSC